MTSTLYWVPTIFHQLTLITYPYIANTFQMSPINKMYTVSSEDYSHFSKFLYISVCAWCCWFNNLQNSQPSDHHNVIILVSCCCLKTWWSKNICSNSTQLAHHVKFIVFLCVSPWWHCWCLCAVSQEQMPVNRSSCSFQTANNLSWFQNHTASRAGSHCQAKTLCLSWDLCIVLPFSPYGYLNVWNTHTHTLRKKKNLNLMMIFLELKCWPYFGLC